MLLTIVLPTYNDINELKKGLNFIHNNFQDINHEVLIVDDGSRFKQEYEEMASLNNARIHRLDVNQGKGAAVQAGVQNARGELIIFTDSDTPYYARDLIKMYQILKDNKVDVVCGSRFFNNSYYENISKTRAFSSKLFSKLTSLLLGITEVDTQCGLKGFQRDCAQDVFSKIITTRYCFDVEIIYKAKKRNYKIDSIPVTLREMTPGSLAFYKDGFRMAKDLMKIFYHFRVLRRNE